MRPEPANFPRLRYAQVWEDADVLLAALDPRPGQTCLSIGSAGDNALALLARAPAAVIAIDLDPVQIACLELRVAAYRRLEYDELLALVGSRPAPAADRAELYGRCRAELSFAARGFWDDRPGEIARGVGGAGKFEHRLAAFRRFVLPVIHRRGTVARLLEPGRDRAARKVFYTQHWDSWIWRALFRLFFSGPVLSWLGRDPSFSRSGNGPVAARLLARTRHALTELDPATNPYLHWILTGKHGARALPFALREENFVAIRENLDRLEWRLESLEDFCATADGNRPIHAFNLSNVFEYSSPQAAATTLTKLCGVAAPGARFVYWNLFAPRSRPDSLAEVLRPLAECARELHALDKTFFYSALVVEERIP